MADEMLRLQLNRDLERFEKAGMDDHVEKVKARLAELDNETDETDEGELTDLKKAELLALAEERGVAVADSMTKAEIVEALEGEEA